MQFTILHIKTIECQIDINYEGCMRWKNHSCYTRWLCLTIFVLWLKLYSEEPLLQTLQAKSYRKIEPEISF